ncbi:DUF348 domain-containing protein [Tissierella creatinini]|nr:DUF348 domain-containing protein [Tissierella creatinini]TJX64531.1 DUF348 domain-containing protein [Soehngenia saccharolytica]
MNSSLIKKAGKFKVLVVLAIVATLSLGFYMYQGNMVSLNLDGEIIEVVSYSKTVGEFLDTEGIDLKEGGYINLPLSSKIKNNIDIIVNNPKNYSIDVNGDLLEITSIHNKVADILKDQKIELGEMDFTFPALDKEIGPNTTIELYRITELVEKHDIEIPFEEQVILNKEVNRGVVKVVQEGKKGLRRSETKNKYINGILDSSVVVKDEIVSEPIPRIVEKGSREQVVATSRGNTRYRKAITMNASAYDSSYKSTGKSPGHKYYGITASGTKARPGVVAVDPRVIPLGTKLYIESLDGTKDYGFAVAEDTGGAIKGNKIDLYFNTNSECINFGRRNVKVYILE